MFLKILVAAILCFTYILKFLSMSLRNNIDGVCVKELTDRLHNQTYIGKIRSSRVVHRCTSCLDHCA